MSPAAPPRELLQALANAGNDVDRASDVIEEFIIYRRGKGDTLFDVSNSLKLLENRGPARTATAIHKAQYVTNVPPASDLTAAVGPSHSSSASPATLVSYLLSEPAPPVAQARQVILEYVLAREHRHQERNHGRGGKHTLGTEGFEEIALRLGEVEDGLRGTGPLGQRGASDPIPDEELSPARQLGLALVLSLRMLLSYFSLPDLARQLLCQTPQDAERTLVQHIRRRSPGDGRFGVGRELEYVESLTLNRRPALRPAFRSARARTHLPQRAVYPIVLPAPSKSACIKLLSAFLRDIDQAGLTAALSYTAQGPSPHASVGSARGRKGSPKAPSFSFGTPHAPGSPVFATGSPSSTNSPTRRMSTLAQLPPDTTPIENYSLELLSEFLTREKREYILKNKWVKSGRDQLGRDLGDIETALCVNKGVASHHAADLLPVLLLLRRTYALPVTQLPPKIVGAAYEMLPTAPEPDSVPLHLPTVSSTTAALYVNPRLDDSAALDHVEELLESEREKGINAAVSEEKTVSWLLGLISQIEKRFPDGSYATVFEQARLLAEYPRAWPDAATSAAFPSHPLVDRSHDGGPGHRRSKSYATTPSADSHGPSQPKSPTSPMSHSRSASMPMRSSLYSSGSDHKDTHPPTSYNDYTDPDIMSQVDPHGGARPPPQAVASERRDVQENDEVDTDSDDSEFARRVAPAGLGLQNTARASQTMQRSRQPPMLSINAPDPDFGAGMFDSIPSARSFTSSVHTPLSATSAAGSYDGWWDVVSSSTDNSPAVPKTAPWTCDSKPDGMMSPSPSGSLARVAEEEEYEAPYRGRDATPETSDLPLLVTRGLQFNNLPPGAGAPVAISNAPPNVGPGSNMSSSTTMTASPMTVTPGGAGGSSSTMSSPMTVTGRSPFNSSTGSHSLDGHVGGTPTHATARTPLTGSPAGPVHHNASPLTQSTDPSPLRQVPAAAAASSMSAAAAAAIAATEAKLGGVSLTHGSPSGSSSSHTTPSTTPTAPYRAAFDNAPPVPSLPPGTQNGSPAGYETQYNAWGAVDPPLAQAGPQRSRTYGSAQHMANTRPPPVPANFDRPGFPSGSNPPGRPRNHSNATPPSSMSNRPMMPPEPSPMPPQQPQTQSPTAPTTTITSATQNFDTSDMGLEFYPSEDAGTSVYKPYTPMLGNLPAAAAPAPKQSKLGGFGRSMSLGGRMGRSKDKENPPAVPPVTVKRQATQTRVANNPERWNKNMVAQLMGPSAAAAKK